MSARDEETLLIVESDPGSRRALVNFLKADYRVCGAQSGKAAWAILAKEKTDLV